MFLSVDQLSYRQGNRILFQNLSFSLKDGEMLWIKGDNGVGKTTLLHILAGYYDNYAGHLSYGGVAREGSHPNSMDLDPNDTPSSGSLLYIGHENGVHANLSVLDNLRSLIGLRHDLGWIKEETELVRAASDAGLGGFEDSYARSLSAGQKKRIALSQLVFPKTASLWVLDEPFTALDVRGVTWLNKLFSKHLESGGIIVLTSHQSTLDELTQPFRSLDLGLYSPGSDVGC